MAHSFIMFFLIATGVELKDMEKAAGWGDSFRRRTVRMKGQVFPAMTAALGLVITNFILGAAAHTRAIPRRRPRGARVGHPRHLRLRALPRVPGARRQQSLDRRGGVPSRGHSAALK